MADTTGKSAPPPELMAGKRHVVWKYRERDGKATKVPYNPRTGAGADCSGFRDCLTFAAAWQTMVNSAYDGVGIVLGKGLAGVDLDHCVTSGYIEPWAQAIVERLNSYAEISPSGQGVKIFLQGHLPGSHRRNGQVEMYDGGRYFTITGWHLPDTPFRVERRPKELEDFYREIFPASESNQAEFKPPPPPTHDLSDDQMITKALASKDGGKFRARWSGDWSGYPSQSEADLALCSKLCFWVGPDPARIDRLYRQSGLLRDKWDRDDYWQRTVAAAVERTREHYKPGNGGGPDTAPPEEESYLYPLDPEYDYLDYIRADFPERPHYMDLFVPQQAYILFAAVSKAGKTILATDIAHCVAFGIPFLGEFNVPVPVKTLILQSEINDTYFQQRVRANYEYLCRTGHIKTIEEHRQNLIIHPLTSVHDLEDPKFDKWLRAFIRHNGIRFLLMDPLQDFTTRADIDNAEMNLFTRHVRSLIKELDISIQVVHHMGKQGQTLREVIDDFRGASILAGRADLFFVMRAIDTDTDNPKMELHFRARYWPPVNPIPIKRNNETFWYERLSVGPAVERIAREICSKLDKLGPMGSTALQDAIPGRKDYFYRAAEYCIDRGWLKPKTERRAPWELARDENGVPMFNPDAKTF